MISNSFRLQYLPTDQYSHWDAFLHESVNGTIFQSTAYIEAISRSFQREVKILTALDQNQIVGGVLLLPRKKLGKVYLTTPFYIPYNGFIVSQFLHAKSERRRSRYQSEVLDLLREELERKFFFIQMDLTAGISDFRCLVWKNWKFIPSFNIYIDLQKEKDLFSQLRRNQQRDIRNFEKCNSAVKPGKDVGILYRLMEQSYRQHHLKPPLKKTVFETFIGDLLEHRLAEYFVVEVNGKPLAALLTIVDQQIVYALFAGKDFKANKPEAESYLHWHLMNHYRDRGMKIFDLLGGMVDSIAHFKFGLGGILQRYDHLYFFRNYLIEMLFKGFKKNQESRRVIE